MVHKARKRFGQHFLHDLGVIDQLLRAIDPAPGDAVVEIGPGLSALTEPLLQRLEHLSVIEIDRDLAARLRARFSSEHLTVCEADALTVDFRQFGTSLRIVGNLPYNISSPLLFHLKAFADDIQDQHFMLQREVVDRMTAVPRASEYGRLSVMLQARYDIERLFDVAPEAFDPPPRVMSAVVRMVPLSKHRPQPRSSALFEALVARAFEQRRKMLRRSLGAWADIIDWSAAGIANSARAQELAVSDFIRLADQLDAAGVHIPEAP